MFNDFLRETPVYQEVLEEGIEKGRQEALQQELQRQRQTLLDIILERFPKVVRFVRKPIEGIEDPAILLRLIVKMSTVQTAQDAQELLLAVARDEES